MKDIAKTESICGCTGYGMEGLFLLFVWHTPVKLTWQPNKGKNM